jgi:tRNA pseudouridine55 synthase
MDQPDRTPVRKPTLCGILNVDKPLGLSSHDVVTTVRKLVGQRKVGHAGTLDPLATGVLLLCLGKATRVSQFLMDSHKVYRAIVRLGISTTTHDREGEITSQSSVGVGQGEVEAAVQRFVGCIDQVPPAYSAIKVKGRRLYHLARQGIAVQAPPRKVDVYRLDVIEWSAPFVTLEVECGPGTYVRALARDLGQTLGCGAHIAALCRTKSGQFTLEQAVGLPELEATCTGIEHNAARRLAHYLHPLDAAFAHLAALHLDAELAYRLSLGQAIPDTESFPEQDQVRAYAPGGRFVGLVFKDKSTDAWRPRKVFVDPEDILPIHR